MRFNREYLGIQGITAGPIKIGPQGPWIVSEPADSSAINNRGALAIQKNLKAELPEFVPMRAGLTSTEDENGVVTVEFLRNYYPEAGAPEIDLSDYTKYTEFKNLYTIVMGANETSYQESSPINTRVKVLETNITNINTSINELGSSFTTLSKQVTTNTTNINALQKALEDISFDPFQGNVLLVAGGANGVEVNE